MSGPIEIEIAGVGAELWPGRALHWPAGRILFIADPHFGKATAFRRLGMAVPDGTAADLERLSALLQGTGAERLVVLGDFFHARSGVSPGTLAHLEAWRGLWPRLEVTLVRGNHDRQAGDPPRALDIECVDEPWGLGPLVGCHIPPETGVGHVLAGHVHPGIALRDRNGARLRAACFVCGPSVTILPAFGGFTGLEIVRPRRDQRVFAVTDAEVIRCGG